MNKLKNRAAVSAMLLLGMTVLLIAVLGAAGIGMQSMRRSDRDVRAITAFQAAQAATEHQIGLAFHQLQTVGGSFQRTTTSMTETLATLAPGVSASAELVPTSDPRRAWVTGTATVGGMTDSVRVYIDSRNVGIWNNAIFAGSGASGRAINGNVDIRGSVHILGEGEPYSDVNGNGQWDAAEVFTDRNRNGTWDPGEAFIDANGDGVRNPAEPFNDMNFNGIYDPPLTQTDLNSEFSGNAYVGNNYSGMPTTLRGLVPNPPSVAGVQTLNTEVRVKHGRIAISGSATIGTSSVVDNGSSKSAVDGVYVSDGFTGSRGASAVFSDNGAANGYDLGNLGIEFPIVTGIGAPEYRDPQGNMWTTHEQYLESRSLTIPITAFHARSAAFTYGPDAWGNRVTFTPETGAQPARLHVQGIVRFANGVTIGSKDTIRYTGNGTLYSRGDINISANLLPAAGSTFPTTARMGFLALRNINLATGSGDSQLSMAGAFYAQGTIVSRKQNQIAGTFVATYYDMGTNVPNIYQVPTLVDNMPPSMPGDKNYYTLKTRSWRER